MAYPVGSSPTTMKVASLKADGSNGESRGGPAICCSRESGYCEVRARRQSDDERDTPASPQQSRFKNMAAQLALLVQSLPTR